MAFGSKKKAAAYRKALRACGRKKRGIKTCMRRAWRRIYGHKRRA